MARVNRFDTYRSQLAPVSFRGPSGIGLREAQRTNAMMVNSLNNMLEFNMKQEEVMTVVEAEKWGAENAVTIEELKNSLKTGEDPNEKFDMSTVFGRTAYQSSTEHLKNSLANSAKQQMNSIMIDAEINKFELDTVSGKLEAVVNEFSNLASETSPILANALSSNLKTVASGHYYKYSGELYKEKRKFIESQALISMTEEVNNLGTKLNGIINNTAVYTNGEINKEKTKKALIEKIYGDNGGKNIFKTEFLRIGQNAFLDKGSLKTQLDNWDKSFTQAINNSIITTLNNQGNQTGKMASAIERGQDTGIPTVDALLSGATDQQRIDIANAIRATRANEVSLEASENSRIEKENAPRVAEIKSILLSNILKREEPSLKLMKELERLDGVAYGEMSLKIIEAAYKKRSASVKEVFDDLSLKLMLGTLTQDDLITHYNDLSEAHIDKFYAELEKERKEVETQEGKDFKDAMIIVAGELEFSLEAIILGKTDPNYAKRNVYSRIRGELKSRQLEARNNNKPFDAVTVAKELVGSMGYEIQLKIFDNKIANTNSIITAFKKQKGDENKLLDNINNSKDMTQADYTNLKEALTTMLLDKTGRGMFKDPVKLENFIKQIDVILEDWGKYR